MRPRKSTPAALADRQQQPGGGGRQRKWHPRVFTGCLNCRRRHVKCDEQTPSCANCARLNMPCTFSLTFVPLCVDRSALMARPTTTGGEAADTASSSSSVARRLDSSSPLPDSAPHCRHAVSATPRSPHHHRARPPGLPAQVQGTQNALYYQHYLATVSTLLIIFDTPSNSNPYRLLLGLVGHRHAPLLQRTMEALGAMHLAASLPGAAQRAAHRTAAIALYAGVVAQLRTALRGLLRPAAAASLELLAVCLLLCLLEKMSAADASWKVHLRGAAHIVHAMYSPGGLAAAGETGRALTLGNDSLSIRRFLVSLLSYLDVAASCATGEAPLIAGDYWETLGGGWQYNLGVPDFAATQCASNRDLAQVRSAWSRLMSVQAEISGFAKLQRSGLDEQQRDAIKAELVYRLRNWHESAPNVFSKLENLDAIPDDATEDEREMLTVTACVGSYALACTIYLERVATKSIKSAAYDGEIKSAVDRVLTLTLNFSHGIHQLAVVWPLLTAGIATVDRHKQELCRQKLSGMNVFGFKHVARTLDTLEHCWRHADSDDEFDYAAFEELLSSNLVP